MSYNTSGVIVRGNGTEEPDILKTLKLGNLTEKHLTWNSATSLSQKGMCSGYCGDWWVLIDQTFDRAYTALAQPDAEADKLLCSLSNSLDVISYAAIGHSDVYGFAVYKNGQCIRRWLTSEGSVEFNQGASLPEEQQNFHDDSSEVLDEHVFEFIACFVPFESLTQGRYRLIAPAKLKN